MSEHTLALSLSRLFEAPNLSGPTPSLASFSPDGRRIAWLRPADDDHERLDLWVHDLDLGHARCVVDARSLGDERALSDVEKARRERLRIFSVGIVEFVWSADGARILFPLAGRLHGVRLGRDGGADGAPEALTPEAFFVTDVRVCQATGAIGFVHGQNLYRMPPDEPPRALTEEGGDTVSWGLPDFIAAEEMHRFDGYFFSRSGRTSPPCASMRGQLPLPGARKSTLTGSRYTRSAIPTQANRMRTSACSSSTLKPVRAQTLGWRGADSEYLARVDWCANDDGLLLQRQNRDQSHLELVHVSLDGQQRTVLEERSDTWVNLTHDLRIFKDGRRALWTSERDDVRRLFVVDLENGQATAISPANAMVERVVQLDEADGTAWVEATFEARTRRQLYAVALDGSGHARISDGVGSHSATVGPGATHWLDRADSLTQPPSLVLRDRSGAAAALLVGNDPSTPAHPYHPWHATHHTPELGELRADDGTPLCYRLTRPADDGRPCPVVLAVYGGPGVRRVTDAWPPLLHQYFARRGWGVLELDNRGSSDRGRSFEAPIHKNMGDVEVRDQLVGVDYLRALDWVDAERIAVFGHSYGGYMALMCLARHPTLFKGAVSVAPVTDWRLYDTHYTERYMGLPKPDDAAYDRSSVFAHMDGLEKADPGSLLLMHGMADDNVLFTHSTRLMREMQDRGIEFDLMTYPGAKHGIAGAATSKHRFSVIERFLARRFGDRP